MQLKSYIAYIAEITVTGTALVYAKSKEEAEKELAEAGVQVAGNKLRDYRVEVESEVRER